MVAVYGKHIKVYFEGEEYDGILRGKLLKNKLESSPVAVGDNVDITIEENNQALIEKIHPRQQYLSRPDKTTPERRQVIAANLDQLVIVSSTKEPSFKSGLVDRFLVSAEKENLPAAIVLNKIDLMSPENFREFARAWEDIGYLVIFTSALEGDGLNKFKELLKGKTSALTGHSGVGKSTLINAVQKDLDLRTKSISKYTGKGVHTTTSVSMYPLDIGGWVADTPGLKIFGIADIEKSELDNYFPEIKELAENCRFDDCHHINEPECAVKKALGNGKLFEGRYKSYKKLWEQLDK